MNKNPLKTHEIGASGCDGTLKGFINSRKTMFEHHPCRDFPHQDFAQAYERLAVLALCDSPHDKKALQGLREFIGLMQHKIECANKGMGEAALTMNTLGHVFDKCSASIDEQIAEDQKFLRVKALTVDQVKAMTKAELEAELSNRVYAVAVLFERMEHAGKINGNGHHKAQRLSEAAVAELNRSWNQATA